MTDLIRMSWCLLVCACMISCAKNKEIEVENSKFLPEYAKNTIVHSGHNRVRLSFSISDDQIKYYKVYWDKERKSRKIELAEKKTDDTVSTVIEGLAEGKHNFKVISFNASGDSSAVLISGKVYGDSYINSIKNREIRNITFISGEDPYIDWADAAKNEVITMVKYTVADGTLLDLKLGVESNFSTLPDYKENTSVSYKSIYVPEPGCIDSFYHAVDVIPKLLKEVPESAYTRYVAPVLKGNGDGKSAVHAADFLDANFWKDIQLLLAQGSVTVKFTAGTYSRAYSEKSFIIDKMGNAQHRLLLEGTGTGAFFTAQTGLGSKIVMMMIRDSQNITVRKFNFNGDGNIQYVLRILGTQGKPGLAKNILIENCVWSDMRGVVYGATGCHYTAEQVTYKGCKFYRIGINHASHMIYNAYGAKHIRIIDSHFEDCTGDFVRYRDDCDYGLVRGSTFIRNLAFPTTANFSFIAIPLFNDVNPGDEHFATNYSFVSNVFTNAPYAFTFYHEGFSPVSHNYLLTSAEGKTLVSGTVAAKKALLIKNFGIDPDKVRLNANQYNNVAGRILFGTAVAYGAVSKGWTGSVDITNLFKESNTSVFSWEN